MARKMTLVFATITCDRCGGVRLMRQACNECGLKPRPHETQPDLDRRRRLLYEIEAVSPPMMTDISTNVDDALDEIPVLLKRVISALATACKTTTQSARGLIEAFGELDARVAFWSERQPRPMTNRGRGLGRSLQLLRRALEVFKEALAEPTMLAAQAKQSEGQRLIDSAARELNVLREVSDSEHLLSADGLGRIGASARALAGGEQTLESLDDQIQRLAGRENSHRPLGLGLSLHLFKQLMLALLDVDECLGVAQFAEKALGDLRSICQDPRWQARHGVVTAQFSSAAFNLSRIDAENDLEAVGAALHLVMQCRDGVIRHCLATLLAQDADEYHALIRRGAGRVIKQSPSQFPELRLNENLSQDLRHAAAHFDYDVIDNTFVSHSNACETQLPVERFVDQVLGYLQTSVSLVVALLSAMAVQEIDVEISRHTPERDVLAAGAMLVGFMGFGDAEVVREEDTLQVSCEGDIERFSAAAAGLAALFPEKLERVCAQIADDQGATRVWEAPVATFRNYSQRDPELREADDFVALTRVMSTVRIDSQPAWKADMWATVVMLVLNHTETYPVRRRVQMLREMRDLARTNEQRVIVETITTIIQSLREASAAPKQASVPAPFRRTSRTKDRFPNGS